MNVAVFGLGYVGLVSSVCLADLGHTVTGIDVNADKVGRINDGHSPITEPGVVESLARARASGRLRATTDPADAMTDVDVVLICVGTPSDETGALDCSALVAVSEQIGRHLHRARRFPVVAVRSTVFPGVIREQLVRELEREGMSLGVDFGLCVNPEFLREGSAIADFLAPPFTLIGELEPASGERLSEMYSSLNAPLYRMELDAASMVKYASNAFHAVKVAFANEIGVLCTRVGVDSHHVMDVFCKDTKLNVSASYLRPGFAFGGSCLPKDLRALLHSARHRDVDLPLLQSAFPSNDLHMRRALDVILSTRQRRVGLFGLSFKANTDDLRESPLVQLTEAMIGRGLDVAVYDEEVRIAHLFGRNRDYIEHAIPHIVQVMRESPEDVVGHGGVLVIGKPVPRLLDILSSHAVDDQLVLDLARTVKSDHALPGNRRLLRIC